MSALQVSCLCKISPAMAKHNRQKIGHADPLYGALWKEWIGHVLEKGPRFVCVCVWSGWLDAAGGPMFVCVCVSLCACLSARVCTCRFVRASVRACLCVCAHMSVRVCVCG